MKPCKLCDVDGGDGPTYYDRVDGCLVETGRVGFGDLAPHYANGGEYASRIMINEGLTHIPRVLGCKAGKDRPRGG